MPQPLRPAVLAAALLALAPIAAQAVQDCELDGKAVNPANGQTTAGKTGLMRCKERDTGELIREQQLRNGVFIGLVRSYENGKLVKEHSVDESGNMEGLAREFSPVTGRVLREAVYDDGHETGLTRSYHPNGQLRRAAFFAEPGERAYAEFSERGQLSGLRCGDRPLLAPAVDDARLCGFVGSTPSQVELFDARGMRRARLAYLAGKRVRSEELYDNGRPSLEDEIVGNQRIERRWSSEGVKRREIAYLLLERGAVKQREQEFSEKGTLVRDQRWGAAGERLSDESYYLNGQPRSKAVYSEGEARTVEITEFHDNGQRAAVGRFAVVNRFQQIPIGLHQRFSDSGVLRAESTFDNTGRILRERSWDIKGRLEQDDEVSQDGSRRAMAK